MINGEKYRDKLLKFIEKRDAGSFTFSKGEEGDFWQCGGRPCFECGMTKERSNCALARLKWLLSEYKEPVKVSKLEYDILKYLADNTKYMYITRNKNGNLYIFDIEPRKSKTDDLWTGHGTCAMVVFNKLFQFIQWEDSKPTAIEDVLNNCEVFE